jgi:hypothetical protein
MKQVDAIEQTIEKTGERFSVLESGFMPKVELLDKSYTSSSEKYDQ